MGKTKRKVVLADILEEENTNLKEQIKKLQGLLLAHKKQIKRLKKFLDGVPEKKVVDLTKCGCGGIIKELVIPKGKLLICSSCQKRKVIKEK